MLINFKGRQPQVTGGNSGPVYVLRPSEKKVENLTNRDDWFDLQPGDLVLFSDLSMHQFRNAGLTVSKKLKLVDAGELPESAIRILNAASEECYFWATEDGSMYADTKEELEAGIGAGVKIRRWLRDEFRDNLVE